MDKLLYKLEIIQGMGATVERLRNQAQSETVKHEHQAGAFSDGASAVNDLMAHVDKDAEEGKLSDEERVVVKRWLKRAVGCLESLSQEAVANKLAAHYRAEGLEAARALHSKEYDRTAQVRQVRLGQIADGSLVPEDGGAVPSDRAVTGGRPGPSIAQQRKAEAKDTEPDAETEDAEAPKKGKNSKSKKNTKKKTTKRKTSKRKKKASKKSKRKTEK